MPYSFKKQAEKGAKNYLKKIEKVVDAAVTLTAEQITKDLSDTFDKCIDDFYLYETTSYYRHEVGKGTGTGWNLYLANRFKVNYSGKNAKSIHFGWSNADRLMGSYKIKNEQQGIEHVIDSVMNGIRFDGDGSNYYPTMTWTLSSPISTEYFGIIKGGTPNSIFEQILNNMFLVQRKLSRNNFSMLYRQYKTKKNKKK